jgi:hypothetical protein
VARAHCSNLIVVFGIRLARAICFVEPVSCAPQPEHDMAAKKSGRRRYGKAASKSVESAMRKRKRGALKSGKGGKGGTVKSRKQAIAIGLSEAREKGAKVPRKSSAKKATRKSSSSRKASSSRKSSTRKSSTRKSNSRKRSS